MHLYDFFVFLLKAGFVVAIVLSILIGVIWPLYLGFTGRSNQRKIESPVRYRPRTLFLIPPEEDEVEIPTTAKSKDEQNKDIVKMALEDPSKTAMLVRNWIHEKK